MVSLRRFFGLQRLLDIGLLLGWMALIFALSSQPRLLEIESDWGEVVVFKGAHLAAYAVLMWLWWRVLAPARQVTRLRLMAAFGLTVLYGVSDEYHQLFVPGRHGRLSDVLIDALGALIMVGLLLKNQREK